MPTSARPGRVETRNDRFKRSYGTAVWTGLIVATAAHFAVFQLCYTGQDMGPIPTVIEYCGCFDRGVDAPGDDDIDAFDFEAFQLCASGPDVLADPEGD